MVTIETLSNQFLVVVLKIRSSLDKQILSMDTRVSNSKDCCGNTITKPNLAGLSSAMKLGRSE